MNSVSDIWSKVLEILGHTLTPVAITTWLQDCEPIDLYDDRLVIYTASNFKKNVIENRFSDMICDALHDMFASDFELVVLGEGELDRYRATAMKKPDVFDTEVYTFENFIVGNSNKFAHAAAYAVATGAATKQYNPLFIYGDSGLGKTHLLHAIRHEIRRRHPEYSIVYVRGDDFIIDLISAIQSGKNFEFREKYRGADVFLMDDVQFIAGKDATQEEFFHTFNTLFETDRQIVFTSDRPPNEIALLSDRLRSRFSSGLQADISAPDFETRMAIILNKTKQIGVTLPNEVLVFIAENIKKNVRQLEGAVNKVTAYRDLMDGELTVSSVAQIIRDMLKVEAPAPEAIIRETAKYYSVDPEEMCGQRRTKNIAHARKVAMYLMRRLTDLTLNEIGKVFGGRDHATVLAALHGMEELVNKSSELSQTLKDITANINSAEK